MSEINDVDPNLLHVSNGPIVRIIQLNKAEEEYNRNKFEDSIYYQVCSIYGIVQDKYLNIFKNDIKPCLSLKNNCKKQEAPEKSPKYPNELIKFVFEELKKMEIEDSLETSCMQSCNFLKDIMCPRDGFKKIMKICQEFPSEWTILQVCKGPRPQTTCSVFSEMHGRDADIYLTILKHARSSQFPEPICIRLSDNMQVKLFMDFSKISTQCKQYFKVTAEEVTTHEAKKKYWENLKALNKHIKEVIEDFKIYIFPWLFLFRGIPTVNATMGSKKLQKKAFAGVDELCDKFNLKAREKVLLSLAALQVIDLSLIEIQAISEELCDQKKVQLAIQKLLQMLQTDFTNQVVMSNQNNNKTLEYTLTNYPIILIVDDQLDHFFWEELNISQEMCRVNSLQCLWKLYDAYKDRIEKGYLIVDVKNGACVIDPDDTLPNTQKRMKSFCKYWLPNWPLKVGEKLTEDEIFNDYFKRDCFLYCGHGSGLQHIRGKRLSQLNIESIVFLFGCDSTRMYSLGLYSDLMGAHYFYHAALCPTLVGTILPALDAKMDEFSVEVFARWVAPDEKFFKGIQWDQINLTLWIKEGIIEPATDKNLKESSENFENFHIGSLCGAIMRIHARGEGKHYYNTVPYICRGLPAWNINVQPLPK